MKLVFTRHARNRMRFRKIQAEEVEKAVRNPIFVENLEGHKRNIWGSGHQGYLRVTCTEEEGILLIISVVRRNKLPKEAFQ